MKGAEAAKPVGSVTQMPAKQMSKGDRSKDDEEPQILVPRPSAKFPSAGLSWTVVVGSILIALTVSATDLFAQRYHLTPAPNTANNYVYRIDALTGRVGFCSPSQCTTLNEVSGSN